MQLMRKWKFSRKKQRTLILLIGKNFFAIITSNTKRTCLDPWEKGNVYGNRLVSIIDFFFSKIFEMLCFSKG